MKTFKINGTAVREGLSENKHIFLAEELEKSFGTLENRPILLDHDATVKSACGKVQSSSYANGAINYSGFLMDKDDLREKIELGIINTCSVGCSVKQLLKESDDADAPVILKGISFCELSLTPLPAVRGTEVKISVNKVEDKKMENKTNTVFKGDKDSNAIKEDLTSAENLVLEHSETGKGYALSFNAYPAKFLKLQCREEAVAPKDKAIVR